MKTISAGVEIVYFEKGKNKPLKGEKYRAKSDSLDNVKDLLKKEIDNIADKYNLDNVVSISIKFTG